MAIGEHGHSIMQKCHLKRAKLKRPNKTAMLPSLQLVVPQVKKEMQHLEKGGYLLADEEIKLFNRVTEVFDKVIVLLNVGGLIDMPWVSKYVDKISAIMCAWQGGMESGNAIADLLSGKVNQSGRLYDTVAHTSRLSIIKQLWQ